MASMLEPTAVAEAEAPVEELSELVPEAEVVEPAPEPAGPIRCEFCGAEYTVLTSKFCDRCGRRFTRVMPEVPPEEVEYHRCPQCGHRNRIGTQICVECGNLIRERSM
jgi:DNA-directed RNA polymerase subunit RPC12/RpoP